MVLFGSKGSSQTHRVFGALCGETGGDVCGFRRAGQGKSQEGLRFTTCEGKDKLICRKLECNGLKKLFFGEGMPCCVRNRCRAEAGRSRCWSTIVLFPRFPAV